MSEDSADTPWWLNIGNQQAYFRRIRLKQNYLGGLGRLWFIRRLTVYFRKTKAFSIWTGCG